MTVLEHAAVAMVRVLTEADVGHDDERRALASERSDRPLDDALGGPRAASLRVLRLGQAEEHDAADSPRSEVVALGHQLVYGEPELPGHRGDRLADTLAGPDEEGAQERVGREPCLARQRSQRPGPAEAAKPQRGEVGLVHELLLRSDQARARAVRSRASTMAAGDGTAATAEGSTPAADSARAVERPIETVRMVERALSGSGARRKNPSTVEPLVKIAASSPSRSACARGMRELSGPITVS